MKVLLIITGLGMGGAERQVCDLADQFVELGHNVFIVSLVGQTINRPEHSVVNIAEIGMSKSFISLVKAYLAVRRIIIEFQPDVVHSHMVHANVFTRLLRLTVHFPKLICTAHNSNEGGSMRMFAYRATDCLCDLSTNVSHEAVEAFITQGAVQPDRMLAVHNGIDTSRFSFNQQSRNKLREELQLTESNKLILAVGRLNKQKDYLNLLNAYSYLVSSYEQSRQSRLAIIGVGEELDKLKATVAKHGLTEYVFFLGMRKDVHDWMSAADVFVLSSAWEGFGLVVAEAMACERIVVATDCGGVKEVVGDTGILVPAKDSVALAQGLEKGLALTREAALVQGRLARQRIVARYSLSVQAERWLELYQK